MLYCRLFAFSYRSMVLERLKLQFPFQKKSLVRKMETDKIDFRTIATMMMSDMDLKSYSDTS